MPVKLHGVDYATVVERLALAHGDQGRPAGIKSVVTDFFQVGTAVLCRAVVTFQDERTFSGTSEVPIGSSQPAEKDAPYECAETSAVGRALANAGYPGNDKGLAGAEEMQLAQRRTASRETAGGAAPAPTRTAGLTPQEWYGAAMQIAQQRGLDVTEFPARLAPDAEPDYAREQCRRLKARLDATK